MRNLSVAAWAPFARDYTRARILNLRSETTKVRETWLRHRIPFLVVVCFAVIPRPAVAGVTLDVDKCEITPSSATAGSEFTLFYRIVNSNSQTVTLWLDAYIQPWNRTFKLRDDVRAETVDVPPHTALHTSRRFRIPDAARGYYHVGFVIWEGNPFDRSSLLASISKYRALEVVPGDSTESVETGTLEFTVVDLETSERLPMAKITIDSPVTPMRDETTDIDGRALFYNQPQGQTYEFEVSKKGYQDYPGSVSLDSSNESKTVRLEILPEVVDLSPTKLSPILSHYDSGSLIDFTYTIENHGNVAFEAVEIDVYASSDQNGAISTGDALLLPDTITEYIGPGDSITREDDAPSSALTVGESYFLKVVIDPDVELADEFTGNNVLVSTEAFSFGTTPPVRETRFVSASAPYLKIDGEFVGPISEEYDVQPGATLNSLIRIPTSGTVFDTPNPPRFELTTGDIVLDTSDIEWLEGNQVMLLKGLPLLTISAENGEIPELEGLLDRTFVLPPTFAVRLDELKINQWTDTPGAMSGLHLEASLALPVTPNAIYNIKRAATTEEFFDSAGNDWAIVNGTIDWSHDSFEGSVSIDSPKPLFGGALSVPTARGEIIVGNIPDPDNPSELLDNIDRYLNLAGEVTLPRFGGLTILLDKLEFYNFYQLNAIALRVVSEEPVPVILFPPPPAVPIPNAYTLALTELGVVVDEVYGKPEDLLFGGHLGMVFGYQSIPHVGKLFFLEGNVGANVWPATATFNLFGHNMRLLRFDSPIDELDLDGFPLPDLDLWYWHNEKKIRAEANLVIDDLLSARTSLTAYGATNTLEGKAQGYVRVPSDSWLFGGEEFSVAAGLTGEYVYGVLESYVNLGIRIDPTKQELWDKFKIGFNLYDEFREIIDDIAKSAAPPVLTVPEGQTFPYAIIRVVFDQGDTDGSLRIPGDITQYNVDNAPLAPSNSSPVFATRDIGINENYGLEESEVDPGAPLRNQLCFYVRPRSGEAGIPAGDYFLTLTNAAAITPYEVQLLLPNLPPLVSVTAPTDDGVVDETDPEVIINFEASDPDPDDELDIMLYADTDQVGRDGRPLTVGVIPNTENPDEPNFGPLPLNGSITSFTWDTSDMPAGDYYIYAGADDGFNLPVYSTYSSAKITIKRGSVPAPPQNFAAIARGNSIQCLWDASPSAEGSNIEYIVYWDSKSVASTAPFANQFAVGTQTRTLIEGLEYGRAYRVSIQALDSDTFQQSRAVGPIAVLLYSNSSNNAPVIISNPVVEGRVDKFYEYIVSAEDPDGDPLKFSLVEKSIPGFPELSSPPPGVSIDPDSGRIAFTPQPGHLGSNEIVIKVVDNRGGSDTQSFRLAIDNWMAPNDAPVFISAVPSIAVVGELFEYLPIVEDANDNQVSVSLSNAPSGMNLDTATGAIVWTPGPSEVGVFPDIEIIARDSLGSETTQSMPLSVEFPPLQAHFSYTPETTMPEPAEIVFTAQPSTPYVDHYSWDFGDGIIISGSDKAVVRHRFLSYEQADFPDDRSYTVELTVTGPGGASGQSDSAPKEIFTAAPRPVAAFTADVWAGLSPLNVQFTTNTQWATSLEWNFGDGTPVTTEASPLHQFSTTSPFGEAFDVSLTASGPSGTVVSTKRIVLVSPDGTTENISLNGDDGSWKGWHKATAPELGEALSADFALDIDDIRMLVQSFDPGKGVALSPVLTRNSGEFLFNYTVPIELSSAIHQLLYVANDSVPDAVFVLDTEHDAVVDTITHPDISTGGAGRFIAFSNDGNYWISDGDQILEFGFDNAYKRTFDDSGALVQSSGMAFGPDNNLYVADFAGTVIRIFDVGENPPASVGDITVDVEPVDIAFGPNGRLFVAHSLPNKVSEYDVGTKSEVRVYTHESLNSPWGVAISGDTLFVSANNSKNILTFSTTDGSFLEELVQETAGFAGIAIGPDGDLYAQNGPAVKKYDSESGELVDDFSISGSDVAFSPLPHSARREHLAYLILASDDFIRIEVDRNEVSVERVTAGSTTNLVNHAPLQSKAMSTLGIFYDDAGTFELRQDGVQHASWNDAFSADTIQLGLGTDGEVSANATSAGALFGIESGALETHFQAFSPNAQTGGNFGYFVDVINDINSDGVNDAVVAAYGDEDGSSPNDSGRAYVISGATGALVYELQSANEEPGGQFSVSGVASIPDIDGDAISDIAVGAENEDYVESNAGRVYLYSGLTRNLIRTLVSPNPVSGGGFGPVDGLQDLNGDGRGEVLVGAKGENKAYVFSGIDGTTLYELAAGATSFGASVSRVPDTNSDGVDDLLIGAFQHSGAEGAAYLFSGSDGAQIHAFVSPNAEPGGRFGNAVAGIPDIDGDALGDVAIGAYWENNRSGRVYLFSGASGTVIAELASPNSEADAFFGAAVEGSEDLNGDGRGDVTVSAPYESPGTSPNEAGRAYVFSGATHEVLFSLQAPTEVEGAHFGRDVVFAGDIDNDANPDFFVGATGVTARSETVGAIFYDASITLANEPPTIGGLPSVDIPVGSTIRALGLDDYVGDDLTLAEDLDINILSPENIAAWIDETTRDILLLAEGAPRTETVQVLVTDSGGLTAAAELTVNILAAPVRLFSDITRESGLFGAADSGDGIALAMVDLDDAVDGIASDLSIGPQFFSNQGNNVFVNENSMAGLDSVAESRAIVVADFSRDGISDVLILHSSGFRLMIDSGDGTFSEAVGASTVLADPKTCTVGDLDLDGDLDVYVVNLGENQLYLNRMSEGGALEFEEAADANGLNDSGNGESAFLADINQDGALDCYVTNVGEVNALFLNDQAGNFTKPMPGSEAIPADSFGVAGGDVNNDGYMDLYVTNGDGVDTLLLNNGDASFADITDTALTGIENTASGRSVQMFDYDHDGWLDLFVSNMGSQNLLYHNDGDLDANGIWDGTFSDATEDGGVGGIAEGTGMGAALADFDADGDLDIWQVNGTQPFSLYRNNLLEPNIAPTSLAARNWLKVDLQAGEMASDPFGARVELIRDGSVWQTRQLHSVSGWRSQNDPHLHFGLESDLNVEEVRVHWPSGHVTRRIGVEANQTLTFADVPKLESILVSPDHFSLQPASAQILTAFGTFSDGNERQLDPEEVRWTSSNRNLADVTQSGIAFGVAEGAAEISASVQDVVSPPVRAFVRETALVGVEVVPEAIALGAGDIVQLQAKAVYDNGTTEPVTELALWQSDDETIARVSPFGRVVAERIGNTTVFATFETVQSAQVAINVMTDSPALQLSPLAVKLYVEAIPQNLPFSVLQVDSESSSVDVTGLVQWDSDNPFVAWINSKGQLVALRPSSTAIRASMGGGTVSNDAQVSVRKHVRFSQPPHFNEFPIANESFTVSASVVGGYLPHSFRWYKVVEGENQLVSTSGPELHFETITLADSGTYFLQVFDSHTDFITSKSLEIGVMEQLSNLDRMSIAFLALMLFLTAGAWSRKRRKSLERK